MVSGTAPVLMSPPISAPITCGITAPGPMIGESSGNVMIRPITISPIGEVASPDSAFAIIFPTPVLVISVNTVDTKIRNGIMVSRQSLNEVLAACTTVITNFPIPAATVVINLETVFIFFTQSSAVTFLTVEPDT